VIVQRNQSVCAAWCAKIREIKRSSRRLQTMRPKFLLLAAAAVLLIGVAQPVRMAAAVTVSDEEEVSATVESVDQAQRSVLLRGPRGGLITIVAGPEVRNLAQVKAGDRVVVRYRTALAANLAKPGTEPILEAAERTERAPPGDKLGAAAEQLIKVRVKITHIDRRHDLVSFVGPARIERTTEVLDPEMRKFLHTLRVGDEVDLTYTEAVAVNVEPMKE
jgi:hypothetical protein